MSNLMKAREWARNILLVGNARVDTTLKLMNIQAERKGDTMLKITITEVSQKMEQERIMKQVDQGIRRALEGERETGNFYGGMGVQC